MHQRGKSVVTKRKKCYFHRFDQAWSWWYHSAAKCSIKEICKNENGNKRNDRKYISSAFLYYFLSCLQKYHATPYNIIQPWTSKNFLFDFRENSLNSNSLKSQCAHWTR